MVEVIVEWLSKDNGGRKNIPSIGDKYYPMIKVNDHEETYNWSFMLENINRLENNKTIAKACFLVEKAPHHLLIKGIQFSIYEGAKLVGYGMVV